MTSSFSPIFLPWPTSLLLFFHNFRNFSSRLLQCRYCSNLLWLRSDGGGVVSSFEVRRRHRLLEVCGVRSERAAIASQISHITRCTACNSSVNNKCRRVKGIGAMCVISFHYLGEMASASLSSKYLVKPSLSANRCCATTFGRRIGVLAITTSTLLATEATSTEHKAALSFDLRMTVPDQTVEEAESVIRDHARALVEVKALIDLEDWREMQRILRKRSSLLKQDIYTIIQSKPRITRPLLRNLYFELFSNVTKLDYAARDQDVMRVQECYKNITATLGDILSRILT